MVNRMDLGRGVQVIVVFVVGALLGISWPVGAAPAPVAPLEGVLASVDATSFSVTGAGGATTRITATADTRIIQRQPARLEDIKPNDFVAVTARREPDGALTAILINIFPPEFKGRVREAQFVMDTGNIMTNAIVFQNVRRIEGRTLYLRLPDGSTVISVPRQAEVFKLTVIKM